MQRDSGLLPERVSNAAGQSWVEALIASSSEVIVGGDMHGNVTVWSRGAAELYGYQPEEIIGRPIVTLRPNSEIRQVAEILERLHRGEVVEPYETHHLRKDGSVVDVQVCCSTVRDGTGAVIGTSAVVRDITEAKRIQKGLEEKVENERRMVETLQELDRTRSTFVSSVSHELRTPLTSILGYLELMSEDAAPLTPNQRDMLEIVVRNSQRLLALIEDLLILSSIESGSFRVLKEPVDVHHLVLAACRAGEAGVRTKGHSLIVDIDPFVGAVLGDSEQLERLIANLLSNATKFTPAGGEIRVSAAPSPDGVVVTVSDSGIGMSESERSEIFEPFFRSAEAMRRAIPGTGLGLSIVKTIVEQHGGTITCMSEPEEGTTMTVLLPFALATRGGFGERIQDRTGEARTKAGGFGGSAPDRKVS